MYQSNSEDEQSSEFLRQQQSQSVSAFFLKYLIHKLQEPKQPLAQQYLNFYNEYARHEGKVFVKGQQQHSEYQNNRGLQMHKLRALSPDHVHKKAEKAKQNRSGPYYQGPAYQTPEKNSFQRSQETHKPNQLMSDPKKEPENPMRLEGVRKMHTNLNGADKIKFPNIALINFSTTMNFHKTQKKEASATNLQLFPSSGGQQKKNLQDSQNFY